MDELSIAALGFDWDEGNLGHCVKHGVSIREIESLFGREFFLMDDAKHSRLETRRIALGLPPASKRPLFVVFTLRNRPDGVYIRPISARYMHEKEVRRYEEIIARL